MKKMKTKIHKDTISFIDRYFRELPEYMWKVDVIRETLIECIWHGLDEGKAEGMICGMLENQHRILIRQLQRKFSPIPDSVIKKIRSSNNIDQLDNWLDQAITADSLKNTGLLSTDKV
jgi:hypothetical protein